MAFDSTQVTEIVGGQSAVDFYALRIKADKSDYDVIDPANVFTSPTFPTSPDLPVQGSPTRANALVYQFTLLLDHVPTIKDDGTVEMTFDNIENSDYMNTRLIPFGVATSGASSRQKPEVQLETGVKRGGALSADKMMLAIAYGAVDPIVSKVEVSAHYGGIQVSSYGGHKDNDYSKMDIKFIGQKPEANITIPKELFDSNLVTVGDDQILYKDNINYRKFLTKGANAI